LIAGIGIMLGAAIIVHMLSILTRPPERRESTVVRVAAGVTIVLAAISILNMFMSLAVPAPR
jgi:hypothetical protein